MFLDSIRERQLEEERKRKEEDGVELASFREYVWSDYAKLILTRPSAYMQSCSCPEWATTTTNPNIRLQISETQG
jgi:hypothetical protein